MALLNPISLLFVSLPLLAAAISGQFSRTSLGIASRTILSVGVAGTFIGNIHMLAQMDDPNNLLPAFSVSLLTALYAAFGKILLDIFEAQKPIPAPVNPGPANAALATTIGLATLVGAMVWGGRLLIFLDSLASGLFLLGTALIAAISVRLGSRCIEGDLARFLPHFGLFILYASIVAVLPVLSDPSEIGPVIAWGFLGHLYCNVASLLIRLAAPHRIHAYSRLTDWLIFASSVGGVCLHMTLVVWSVY